jgi:hypothetical protein
MLRAILLAGAASGLASAAVPQLADGVTARVSAQANRDDQLVTLEGLPR